MNSVCIATYNGGKYIKEQIESILPQLGSEDEIIISDDSSSDNTLDIISSFGDSRIKIYPYQKFKSPIFNFENAIKEAKGDYIFLSDQDDVWLSNKIDIMKCYLKYYTMVSHDAYIVDSNLHVIRKSLSSLKKRPKGVFANIKKNQYSGCCLAFRRELLNKALPFPKGIAMHDIWLGICSSAFYSVAFVPARLIMYRRHGDNVSPTGEKSNLSWSYRFAYRLHTIYYLIKRCFAL